MTKKVSYPCFKISKGRDKKFYWVLIASNGRTILRAVKGYKTKQNAQKNIMLVLKNGSRSEKYDYETANVKGNGYYFWLNGRKSISDNGTINMIAISGNGKNYNSINWQIAEMGYKKGIASCIANLKRVSLKIESGDNWLMDTCKDKRKRSK